MSTTFDDRVRAALGGTHALVDLDALAGNLAAVRACLAPGTQVFGVVKANAYGHGLIPCARALVAAGAERLAVARLEEALALRAAGIAAPILVLSAPNPERIAAAACAGIAVAVGSLDTLRSLAARLVDAPPLAVHLKVDTGMRRYGVLPPAALALAEAIAAEPRVRLEGLFTHLATADEADDRVLRQQLRVFAGVRRTLAAAGIRPPLVHAANSAAILRGVARDGAPGAGVAARPGLILYGLPPSGAVPAPAAFRPVLTLRTRVARVFTLEPGEGVGYGLTFVAGRRTRCATLPIGYGDGLSLRLSNRGWVSIHGAACPIRGRVSMDQTVVEVDAAAPVAEGDEAVVLGDGADAAMTVEQAARLDDSITYEVVTALAARVPRVFLRDGRPVAVSDLLGLAEAEDA